MAVLEEFRLAISSGRNVVSLQCQLPERLKIIPSIAEESGLKCYSNPKSFVKTHTHQYA
jgi:hypothetical protein